MSISKTSKPGKIRILRFLLALTFTLLLCFPFTFNAWAMPYAVPAPDGQPSGSAQTADPQATADPQDTADAQKAAPSAEGEKPAAGETGGPTGGEKNSENLSSQMVFDPAGVIGQQAPLVNQQVTALAQRGIYLYVAIIPSYNDLAPQDWNKQTLSASSAPVGSYILSFATQDRKYGATTTQGSSLPASEVSSLADQYAAPGFADGKIGDAVLSFAQQLALSTAPASTNADSEEGSASLGSALPVILFFVIVTIASILLGIFVYRRGSAPSKDEKAKEAKLVPQASPKAAEPIASTADTKTDVDVAPVEPVSATSVALTPQTLTEQKEAETLDPTQSKLESPAEAAEQSTKVEPVSSADSKVAQEPVELAENLDASSYLAQVDATLAGFSEDLAMSQKQFGHGATKDFAQALNTARLGQIQAWSELGDAQEPADAKLVEAGKSRINAVASFVDSFTKMRHRPSSLASSIKDLSDQCGRIGQDLTAGKALAQNTLSIYPKAQVKAVARDLARAQKLLVSAKNALENANNVNESGDSSKALRYVRGSERAIFQAEEAVKRVEHWRANLDETHQLLAANATKLREALTQDLSALSAEKIASVRKNATVALAQAAKAGEAQFDPLKALDSVNLVSDVLLIATHPTEKTLDDSFFSRSDLLQKRLLLAQGQLSMTRTHTPVSFTRTLASANYYLQRAQDLSTSDVLGAIKSLSKAEKLAANIEKAINA